MMFSSPKKWARWLIMKEYWYNLNFHTSLKITPFEALYGYTPSHLSLGSIPKRNNQTVTKVLEERIISEETKRKSNTRMS
jgi:hypothetical protein